MAKVDIWMPLYVADLIADTTHLSNNEFGAYMRLICAYWRNRGPLPETQNSLRNICHASKDEWQELRETLADFFETENGHWRHDRVDIELDAAIERKEAQFLRTRKATAARLQRNGHDDRNVTSDVTTNVTLSSSPSPSPSPSPSESPSPSPSKSDVSISSKPKPRGGVKISDDDFLKAIRAAPAYSHIDIDFELGRMDTWLLAHPGRTKNRRFVVNWLNKIDKPIGTQNGKGGLHPKTRETLEQLSRGADRIQRIIDAEERGEIPSDPLFQFPETLGRGGSRNAGGDVLAIVSQPDGKPGREGG